MKANKLQSFLGSKQAIIIFSFIGLFLLSSGTAWLVFSYIIKPGGFSPVGGDVTNVRSKINLDAPKTETCPTNGAMYTAAERTIWEGRRPILAMIENSVDARPLSGLSKTDVIYEAVAEGGITRFLAVIYCGVAADEVEFAPIRSARIYFINWAQEWGNKPLFVHVGGANDFSGSGDTARDVRALEVLETLGWRVPKGNDIDTIYDAGYPELKRNPDRLDHPVASEHTMIMSADELYKEAQERSLTNKDKDGKDWNSTYVPWKFADDKPSSSPKATSISFEFWSNKADYDVEWKYDKEKNQYLRFNGGKPHTDLEFKNEQLTTKNVLIQFVAERGPVDRNHHMFYQTIGSGKMLLFQNGDVIEGTWKKEDAKARTKYFDGKGAEISFVRGRIWIEAVPVGNDIAY